MRGLVALVTVLTMTLLSADAIAKKPKKAKAGKKKARIALSVGFNDDERDLIKSFFIERHGRGQCPPGLAKKKNGCLPPGQVRKRYVISEPLAAGVEFRELPEDLKIRIGRPPDGYRYVMVDGDIVKLAIGTLLVVDAIDSLVD